jgi:hypothetical protein
VKSIATTASDFVRRIAARRLRREGAVRRMDLPLVQGRWTFVRHVWQRHVRAAATVNARLVTMVGHDERAGKAPASSAATRGPQDVVTPLVHTHTKYEHLALRIVERLKRVEGAADAVQRSASTPASGDDERARTAHRSSSSIAAGDLPMPLARPASAVALRPSIDGERRPASDVAARGADVPDRPLPPRGYPQHAGAASMLHDGDIRQIAARVIGSIDRRIVAERERLGRI